MAAGDIVSGINSVGGAQWFTIQPAAGVEVMIFATIGTGASKIRFLNAAGDFCEASSRIATDYPNALNVKIGINNTNYLQVYNAEGTVTYFGGMSGIQIK
tara:strand:- start:280 stop:579 length:300 start_codon:yes stop_codon:yes gene_type:complete